MEKERIKRSLEAHGIRVIEIDEIDGIRLVKSMIGIRFAEYDMYFSNYHETYIFCKNLGLLDSRFLVRRRE